MNTMSKPLVSSRSLTYRIAVFGYGVAAYVIGVAALLALILTMLGVQRWFRLSEHRTGFDKDSLRNNFIFS